MNNPTTIRVTPSSESARYAQIIRGKLEDKKVVIAVEGRDDLRIIKKLFNRDVVIVPTKGVDMLLRIDTSLYDYFPNNFISIKDADFDHLNNTPTIHDHVFVTDKHDMEMTMIDEEIIENILIESINDPDVPFNYNAGVVISQLLVNLRLFSYIKWLNNVENCSINFDMINVNSLEGANHVITISESLSRIYSEEANNNGEIRIVTEQEVKDFIDNHPCDDLSMLVCGHDFCYALLDWMKNQGLDANMKRSVLEGKIRIQYNSEKFRNTNLYHNIHLWEIKYNRSIVA